VVEVLVAVQTIAQQIQLLDFQEDLVVELDGVLVLRVDQVEQEILLQ
tara:strand:- start:277 stop:417 length:141 start_codon:yes stop_codon:yes gene_type:complete